MVAQGYTVAYACGSDNCIFQVYRYHWPHSCIVDCRFLMFCLQNCARRLEQVMPDQAAGRLGMQKAVA
jgi:hypothetical protein